MTREQAVQRNEDEARELRAKFPGEKYLIGYVDRREDSIRCLTCGTISYGPGDVKTRYCGFCYKFHDLDDLVGLDRLEIKGL